MLGGTASSTVPVGFGGGLGVPFHGCQNALRAEEHRFEALQIQDDSTSPMIFGGKYPWVEQLLQCTLNERGVDTTSLNVPWSSRYNEKFGSAARQGCGGTIIDCE